MIVQLIDVRCVRNGDGTIDPDELAVLLGECIELDVAAVQETLLIMFNTSYCEATNCALFYDYFLDDLNIDATPDRLADAFAQFDQNGDGVM